MTGLIIAATLAGCALLAIPVVLLRRRSLRASSFTFVLCILGTVTTIATVGQGIRDIAIIAFPIVFVLAGLTLDRRLFRTCVGFALVAICWLVLGEIYGWFAPKPFVGIMETWLLFVIASVLLLVAALAVELLATNVRKNLSRAEDEIAQRNQAEESLRENDFRFCQMSEQSRTIVWDVDTQGLYTYVSQTSESVWGYQPDEIVGRMHFYDLHPQSGREEFKTAAFAVFEKKEKFQNLIKPVETKDGHLIWVSTNGIPMINPDGTLKGYRGSDRDITDRKKAEMELLYKTALLEAQLNAAIDGILIVDSNGKKILQNRRTVELWKIPQHIADDPDDSRQVQHVMHLTKNSDEFVAKITYLYAHPGEISKDIVELTDGTVLESYSAPVLGNNDQYFGRIWTFHDITVRKQAEIELKKSAALIRTAIENLPLIFYMIDCEGTFRLSIGAGLKGLGLEQNQVVGQSVFDVYKDFPEIINSIRKALAGETVNFESHVASSSYLNICIPFSEMSEGPGGIVAVALDITERRNAEEALRNIQKLESLGLLAGGIAHDFNNLMCGIFGYIDMAIESSTDDKVTRYLSKSMNTIDRARALTQQLLTFAKGGAPIQQTGNLFPFVQETAQFALSGANVSSSFDVPENLWQCNFDKNQFGQVIDNIVINAKQAMSGGGSIELSAKNITFAEKEHPALTNGDYVKISIRDYGIGIPKEILPRIFDPFYTTKATGHGLGLATCYSIIKRHGGCIEVESQPGKGSTFHIYLPASKDSNLSNTMKTAALHKGKGVFLVMDDQEVMRDTIGDMLESLGYTAVCKENGNEAIKFVSSETKANRKIAGMIFDLTIPGGMGGKEAIGEIRKLDSKTPVFVTSGYAEDPIMAIPNDHGFTASICKPFRKSELSAMLNKFMKDK